MIILIIGGSSSGKSEYAESLAVCLSGSGSRYYIATMDGNGDEARRRIKRHLALREGKGFITVERPADILNVLSDISCPENSTLLIESLSTLLANEMFMPGRPEDNISERICEGMAALCRKVKNVIIVSDDIFEDGIDYDELTGKYIEYLGQINMAAAREADGVIQVTAGIPACLKPSEGVTEMLKCQNTQIWGTDSDHEDKGMSKGFENRNFTLVTGGRAQGKLSWVLENLAQNSNTIIFDENNGFDPQRISENTEHIIINHFHKIIRQINAGGIEAEQIEAAGQASPEKSSSVQAEICARFEQIMDFCSKTGADLIVISDEVGSGVIPAEAKEISYRENVGGALAHLAKKADAVYKVTCGIGTVLKPFPAKT